MGVKVFLHSEREVDFQADSKALKITLSPHSSCHLTPAGEIR
jgi:hypothetical protein